MKIISLDTESTSTGSENEMLELSVLSGDGEIIHNCLYKPEKIRRWRHSEKIHGISPAMVKDEPFFRRHIPQVRAMFDDSDLIIGFAVDNDFRLLESYGFDDLRAKSMDVRDMFWVAYGAEQDFGYFRTPNLVACAETCGYVWAEGAAHCAAADAEATLFCFYRLLAVIAEKNRLFAVSNRPFSDAEINTVKKFVQAKVQQALHEHEVEKAKGWLYIVKTTKGYRLVARKRDYTAEDIAKLAAKKQSLVARNYLADMHEGYEYILRVFASQRCGGDSYFRSVYRLTDSDIEFFRGYHNSFSR